MHAVFQHWFRPVRLERGRQAAGERVGSGQGQSAQTIVSCACLFPRTEEYRRSTSHLSAAPLNITVIQRVCNSSIKISYPKWPVTLTSTICRPVKHKCT
jgi:hypothetical protein